MSDLTDIEGRTLSRAEAVEMRAADWMLARQAAESWSAEDQSALDAWLAESTSHVAAYWRLDDAWSRAKRLKALRSPMRPSQSAEKARAKPRTIAIAAALTIAAVLVGAVWSGQFRQSGLKTYSTPVGGHLALTLADGSKITLNTNTTLTLSPSARHRYAILQKGEAYFEIRHDKAHPFVVSVGAHRITDLGTEFLVRGDAAHVSVALIKGSARFESQPQSATTQSTDLAPGDVVVATATSMSVSKNSDRELKTRLAWRRGLLIFDNATLADAAAELNRYNRQQVIITDATVGKLVIGGTFYENDVPALLNTARQVFGLKVHKRGDQVVISH